MGEEVVGLDRPVARAGLASVRGGHGLEQDGGGNAAGGAEFDHALGAQALDHVEEEEGIIEKDRASGIIRRGVPGGEAGERFGVGGDAEAVAEAMVRGEIVGEGALALLAIGDADEGAGRTDGVWKGFTHLEGAS